MKVIRLMAGLIATNTYLVSDAAAHAVIIDPAANSDRVLAAVRENNLCVEKILLTHGHFDHIGAVDALAEALRVPVMIAGEDAEMLTDAEKNASLLFIRRPVTAHSAVHTFADGDVIAVGSLSFSVMATPGHTRGSVCFFASENGTCDSVFTGDTLFADGEGRTDLYGGDAGALRRSVAALLPQLAGKTICPGHGEAQTFPAF